MQYLKKDKVLDSSTEEDFKIDCVAFKSSKEKAICTLTCSVDKLQIRKRETDSSKMRS